MDVSAVDWIANTNLVKGSDRSRTLSELERACSYHLDWGICLKVFILGELLKNHETLHSFSSTSSTLLLKHQLAFFAFVELFISRAIIKLLSSIINRVTYGLALWLVLQINRTKDYDLLIILGSKALS